jgi:hypothetical protein
LRAHLKASCSHDRAQLGEGVSCMRCRIRRKKVA